MMKRIANILILIHVLVLADAQIIADHTVVDLYVDIPQQWIDSVKTKWISYAGESHSEAIRYGLEQLENQDATYAVAIQDFGTPASYTTSNLRASRATWGDIDNTSGWIYDYGEEDFWTSSTAVTRTENGLTYMNENGYELDYFGFGWCYDAAVPYNVFSETYDPVYAVRWMGESLGSSTESVWGLDAADNSITGNDVNMQTYIDAVIEYIDHCETNGYQTKVFFTTGTVDDEYSTADDEPGYQQWLKWEYIRNVVEESDDYMLFDYADILCWNDSDEESTTLWTDNDEVEQSFPIIHDDNTGGEYVAHIGSVGALRLAKAMWWFLARAAGWDGGISTIPVTGVEVTSAGGITEITAGETLQFTATVLPVDATNPAVVWSVVSGTGTASISSGGLLTGLTAGTVNAVATAVDGSGITGVLEINIIDPAIPVTGVEVTSAGGITEITAGETLQFTATVLPVDATNPAVVWSVVSGTGTASISSGGLLTGLTAGTVNAVATAADGSGISDSFSLTINNVVVLVTDISIVAAGGNTSVEEGSTLQFTATVLPADATNPAVAWSVVDGTGAASISSSGLLTGLMAGTVSVVAMAQDESGIGDAFALMVRGPSGLTDREMNSMISVYPNPSPGQFYLDVGDLSIEKIEVVSAEGSVILELLPRQGESLIEVDLSEQYPGAFFIRAFSKEQFSVQGIIIIR